MKSTARKASTLTALAVERAKPRDHDYYLTDDDGTRGGGRLTLRVSPAGSKLWYYRYSINGERKALPLLPFSPRPMEGHQTLEQARARVRALAELHRKPESRDVAAYLDARERERLAAEAAAREEAERHASESARAAKYTLRALCEWYVKYLEAAKRQSARDVHYIFNKHVYGSALAGVTASSVTPKQATELFRKIIVDEGKGRTASKTRAYLRAAYRVAQGAESNANAPAALAEFGIETNPIADTAPITQFNRARENPVKQEQLRWFWRHLAPARGGVGTMQELAIVVAVLLCGQRFAQLLRVKVKDVDEVLGTITLRDPKGRRAEPRKHVLPLVGPARELVLSLKKRAEALESDWLFPGAKEGKAIRPDTINAAFAKIRREMRALGTLQQDFVAGDLRSTVETIMAGLKVTSDVMAQVQSHGLSGVQLRHYNRYEYWDEKCHAMTTWAKYLDELCADTKAELAAAAGAHQ